MKVKTNRPRDALRTVDLNGREMIRGDKFTLAICTVRSKTEKKNTMKLSIEAAIIPTAARAPWTPNWRKEWWRAESNRRIKGAQITAASMEPAGTTHREFRKKLLSCLRCSQNIRVKTRSRIPPSEQSHTASRV